MKRDFLQNFKVADQALPKEIIDATLTLQNGVDIKTVSGMLGHFFAGFTLDTYAHVTTAAQTMGNVLNI